MIEKVETKRKKSEMKGMTKVIDPNTGEFIPVMLFGQSNEFVDKNFSKIFHAFTRTLIADEEIAGKAIRLLFWIIDQLKPNDIHFYMSYKIITKELKIGRMTYFRWKKTLEEKNIIKKVDTNLYMINPACIAIGKANTLLEEWNKKEK